MNDLNKILAAAALPGDLTTSPYQDFFDHQYGSGLRNLKRGQLFPRRDIVCKFQRAVKVIAYKTADLEDVRQEAWHQACEQVAALPPLRPHLERLAALLVAHDADHDLRDQARAYVKPASRPRLVVNNDLPQP